MRKALVADDDPAILRLVSRWIAEAGYEVRSCSNFEAARRALDDWRPDILVSDVRLGDFNGLQLVIHAKADNPSLAAVVVTGYDDPVLRKDSLAAGAAYLVKPLKLDDLLAAIDGQ